MNIKGLLFALFATLVTNPTFADTKYVEPAYAISLHGSPDIPDAVAFRALLIGLEHDYLNDDIDSAIYRLRTNLELIDETESAVLLGQLIAIQRIARIDEKEALQTHYCSTGEPYDLLQRGYDVTEAVWNNHLLDLIDTLPSVIAVRMDQWIDEMKLNASYSRFDFKEQDRRTGRDSTGSIRAACLRE